ncbi:MAG TPA: hypothetical protein VHY78_07175 [Stellaceae bacterium]|jgi:hypothetical protein|nr:hypothetical protein [Stellaceae bacterium]
MQAHQAAAFAALLTIASSGAALAQMPPMPTHDPAAKANVRESEQYTAALRSNPAFRRKREQIECGPITDPQLHANCIASFEAYAAPAR